MQNMLFEDVTNIFIDTHVLFIINTVVKLFFFLN